MITHIEKNKIEREIQELKDEIGNLKRFKKTTPLNKKNIENIDARIEIKKERIKSLKSRLNK